MNTENEIKIFTNSEFGDVRTLVIDDKPYFVGKDVAEILGYERATKATVDNVDEEDRIIIDGKTQSCFGIELGQRGGWVINESGLYSLIINSKMPKAKEFKRWITSEVLPTIRKTGGYVNDDELFVNTYLPFADDNTKLLFKQTLDVIEQQNKKLLQQQPLVDFANQVSGSSNAVDMNLFAKFVRDENIDIGRNRLFKWLRDCEYLMEDNQPYQTYINQGYFEVVEKTYQTAYGVRTYHQTLVTGKGQICIVERLRKEFGKIHE